MLRVAADAGAFAADGATKSGEQLREFKPDVVLITPLVYLGSWQFEVLRAAQAEGLRTAFAVGSWDHLSSKALVRDVPQRVFVWNETQKAEAVRLHGVPADRVVVTGAQCYDQWFGRQPVRTREEFCALVGLPSDRPFVLYVCSALFWGSPVEAEFVCRWIRSLRSSEDAEVRSAAILIRPHPGAHGRVEVDRSRRSSRTSRCTDRIRWMPRRGRTTSNRCSTAARSSG